MEALDEQTRIDEMRDQISLQIDYARIASGEDINEVLAPYLDETSRPDQDGEDASPGEEVYDLTNSPWESPGEDEMDVLDQLMAANSSVTVPNSDLIDEPGQPMTDDAEERQWL